MDEKDAAEKNRARRSRRTSASRPGAESENAEDATAAMDAPIQAQRGDRPGASTVRGEEAARLDDRIAAKQKGHKSRSTGTSATSRQLNQLEEDVATKTRARGTSTSSANRAGAQLRQTEQAVISQTQAHSGSRNELNNLEARIVNKTRAPTRTPTSTQPSTSSTAQQLDRLESAVSRKYRGASSTTEKHEMKNEYEDTESFLDEFKIEAEQEKNSTQNQAAAFSDAFHQDRGKEFDVPSISTSTGPSDAESVPTLLAAQGIVNEPDVEYGTYGGGADGHGYDDTLAVAVAVSGEEEDAFIPAAIEYDPDSKPPIYKNKRFRLYVVSATLMLIAIGIGASLGVVSLRSGSPAPTSAPTTWRESLGITDQLVAVIGEATLADPESPQARAADWILNKDPRQLPPEADNLIQRFLLTLFYLATSERKPWRSCNPPLDNETSICNFTKLTAVYPEFAFDYLEWGRWLSEEHECNWAGVFCDEFNQTRALELPGQEIRGTMPTEIALMPYLQSLTFNWNEFYGTMPSELASMKHLLNIEFHYNFFTGQVPPQWYEAQALQRVNYAGNFLSGTIPTEIGQLSTMKGFFNFENSIGGTVPSEIGKMKFLSFTRWGRNFMTGTLPTEIGNLEKLQELWMHRNQFTGRMPSEMGKMRDLGDLRLHFNTFSGSVPDEHYNMPQLRRWDLYDCNITSTISTAIGNMTNLATYRIRGNNFYGTIPTEMGNLSGLLSMWMHQNDLTGTVPLSICTLRSPSGLVVLDADCGPTNGVGAPMLDCMLECCTACCDSVTGYCLRDSSEVTQEVEPNF